MQSIKFWKSIYYFYEKEKKSANKILNDFLGKEIKDIFENSRKTYGIYRIKAELKSKGINVGHNKIAKIKRDLGVYPKIKRRYKKTTDSNHNERVNENLLNREFRAEKPNEKWVSDIT